MSGSTQLAEIGACSGHGGFDLVESARLHGSLCRASGAVHLEPSGEPRCRELGHNMFDEVSRLLWLCQVKTGGLFVFGLLFSLVSKTG